MWTKNPFKSLVLLIIGISLCLIAILLSPIAKKLPISLDRPWVDGLVINTLRSYKKYNTKSWIRRMIGMVLHPDVVLEYLKLLATKKKVIYKGIQTINLVDLQPSHYVQTTHDHHRERVNKIKLGDKPKSDFGHMMSVGLTIHDGNHRLAAYREAGFKEVDIGVWEVVEK